MADRVLQTVPLGFQWPTAEPFLFCVHHLDRYPAATAELGPAASLAGRPIGQDFEGIDGWRMYHGSVVPGFPQHPHRGFETVTYMIAGRMRHKDSAGHEGLLQNGGVQWMTAGRGLVHSEMPEQEEGVMEGFQLWLNLPGKDKLCAPWYRDIQSADIPEFQTAEGVTVRVIAGESVGPQGPVAGSMRRAASAWPTDPLYLDLHFPSGTASFSQHLAADHNAFIYVYRGTVEVVDTQGSATHLPQHRMAILANEGDGVTLRASAAARALLIAGRPLREPIAQYGPFVMNTRHELMQAVEDFQAGRFV